MTIDEMKGPIGLELKWCLCLPLDTYEAFGFNLDLPVLSRGAPHFEQPRIENSKISLQILN